MWVFGLLQWYRMIQKVVPQRKSTSGCEAWTLPSFMSITDIAYILYLWYRTRVWAVCSCAARMHSWRCWKVFQLKPRLLLIFPFSSAPSWYDYLKEFCSWLCNKSPLRSFSLPLPPLVPPCQWRAALTGAGLQVALSEDGGDPGGIVKAVVIRTQGWGIQNGPSCCSVFSPETEDDHKYC